MSPFNLYYLRSFFCETAACSHNTYNDGSTIYCQPCPANSGHSLTGSRSVSDCKCFKGYQGRPESGNPCTGEKDLFFAPLTRYIPEVFENGSFLSVSISLLSTRKRRFRAPETLVFIYYPQKGDFWKRRLLGFSLYLRTDETVIHHILLALSILLKGCYRKSVILAFSCGRAKKLDI